MIVLAFPGRPGYSLAPMTDVAIQITARGPRLDAEAAAEALDADLATEAVTYSILEEIGRAHV